MIYYQFRRIIADNFLPQFTFICVDLEMTTIEYGGGPNLEQRRAFAGLKDGSMVPGFVICSSLGLTLSEECSPRDVNRL